MVGEGAVSSELTYVFSATDNVTGTVERMTGAANSFSATQKEVMDNTTRQNIAFQSQVIAVSATYAGMRRLTSSMEELGIISEKDAQTLHKVNAAVGLVVGSFQLLKGAVQIVNMLKEAEIGLSIIETYRAVLNKGPAAVALVGVGLGLAAGIAGYLIGAGSSNVNQTVVFEDSGSTEQRATARDTLEIMGG